MNPTRLNKLKELLKIANEGLTREEFTASFKQVLDIFLAMKQANKQKQEKLVALAERTLSEIKNNAENLTENQINTFRKLFAKLEKQQQDDLNFIRDKVSKLKNGKDGEDGKTPTKQELQDLMKPLLPLVKEKTPQEIRDMLESLEGEARLRIEAIHNLEERLKELEGRPIYRGGGGGFSVMAMEQHIIDDATPTGTVNGVNTDFTIAHKPSPATSLKVYVNGQRFKLTEDYTLSGVTISFVTAPPTGSIITCDYRI